MQRKQEDMAFPNTHRETNVLCQQPISLALSQQALTLFRPLSPKSSAVLGMEAQAKLSLRSQSCFPSPVNQLSFWRS